jgi:hypothetical protein
MRPPALPASRIPAARGRPLKQAIQECEGRWFQETLVAARDGEPNQMALLGHMYTVGYGCAPCQEEANHWLEEASKRLGYHPLEAGPLLGMPAGPAPQAGGGGLTPGQQQQQQQQDGRQQPDQQRRRGEDEAGPSTSGRWDAAPPSHAQQHAQPQQQPQHPYFQQGWPQAANHHHQNHMMQQQQQQQHNHLDAHAQPMLTDEHEPRGGGAVGAGGAAATGPGAPHLQEQPPQAVFGGAELPPRR